MSKFESISGQEILLRRDISVMTDLNSNWIPTMIIVNGELSLVETYRRCTGGSSSHAPGDFWWWTTVRMRDQLRSDDKISVRFFFTLSQEIIDVDYIIDERSPSGSRMGTFLREPIPYESLPPS